MAEKTLTGFKRGIDRQRLRATPTDGTWYELLNCYVTASGTIRKRAGFRKLGALDATTRGLYSNNGILHAFYTGAVIAAPTGMPLQYDGIQPLDITLTLQKVWADYLFLGRQYVAAQMSDGNTYHFWLPSTGTDGSAPAWQADHQYNVDAAVQPTTPNGYFYTVANNQFPQAWQPNTTYSVGDVIVPTVLNGWKYTLIEADGENPSSGSTEPTWPTEDGATVTEEHDDTSGTTNPPALPPSDPGGGRYGNTGGAIFNLGRDIATGNTQ